MFRVFAVDDDTDMLDMMDQILSAHGCSVASATRYKGTIDKIRAFIPDVILLDVMLPDGSGYQISRSVRADPSLYRIPIVFVSAIADEPEVAYAISQGCDAYLQKPFSIADLTTRLNEMSGLTARIKRPASATGLVSLEAITREVDHRIFQQRAFSLCYVSIERFETYQNLYGAGEAAKLIAMADKAVQQTWASMDCRGACAAHIGREYFLALLPFDAYSIFCRRLHASFAASAPDGFSLRMDVAVHDEVSPVSTHALLRELQGAHKKPEGGRQRTLFRWNLHQDW